MEDICLSAAIRSARLEILAVTSTELCIQAQEIHELESTSAIALGRLLTAATLATQGSMAQGAHSLQVTSSGRIRSVYADATQRGAVRGFIKEAKLDFPVAKGASPLGRSSVAAASMPGDLSVIRELSTGGFSRGTTPLVSGEIDLDLEHFFKSSDQLPTALACEVLVNSQGKVTSAAGILIQALPDGNKEALSKLRESITGGALVGKMSAAKDCHELLHLVSPEAVVTEDPVRVRWECRCSLKRVTGALRAVSPVDLAEIIEEAEIIDVECDLCRQTYAVSPDEVRKIFETLIQAQG